MTIEELYNELCNTQEYIICFYDSNNNRVWEYVYGIDVMNIRVDELVEHFDCHVDEIKIFKMSDDLNLTD